MKNTGIYFIGIFTFILFSELKSQITPYQAIQQMGRGINIGNTLEPPTEGGWNNGPVQEYYFDDYKAAGFTNVRIPITWDMHVLAVSPYTVDTNWMKRIEQVVDWGLSRDLFIVINAHHDGWIKTNYNATNKGRLDSIWSQIALRFKDKSEKLLFEIINEPEPLAKDSVDQLNARIVSIIRKTNPTRIIIYSGHRWSNSDELLAATIPNDTNLIGYFHSYDPWPFGLEGTGSYTFSSISATKSKFDAVSSWSATKNIPVYLGEFGSINKCEYNSRMLHYASVTEQALNHGFAFSAWDDGGDFQIYLRDSRKWKVLKDILIHTYKESPTRLQVQVSDTIAMITWSNRTTKNDSIIIEKGDGDNFSKYATVAPDASSFTTSGLTYSIYHYFRLKTYLHDTLMYSYPFRFLISPPVVKVNDVRPDNFIEIISDLTEDNIIIKTDVLIPGAVLSIYNISGKKIYSAAIDSTESLLDISQYEKGLYILRLENARLYYSGKFIKK